MKSAFQFIVVICMLASISNAAFDYTISDTFYYGTLTLNNETLLVNGTGISGINARSSSYVEIESTLPYQVNIGGVQTLDLNDSSIANIYGGEVATFTIWDQALLVVQGGRIDYLHSHQYISQPNQEVLRHIEIICREYDSGNPNLITGIWDVDNDGDGEFDTFAINLVNQTGYDRAIDNIEFTIIPEPATLLLLGIGGFLIRKKR